MVDNDKLDLEEMLGFAELADDWKHRGQEEGNGFIGRYKDFEVVITKKGVFKKRYDIKMFKGAYRLGFAEDKNDILKGYYETQHDRITRKAVKKARDILEADYSRI